MANRKKNKKEEKAQLNPELDGLDIAINSFGEIKPNFDIRRINDFLNRNVDDKKLVHREDFDASTGTFATAEEKTEKKSKKKS